MPSDRPRVPRVLKFDAPAVLAMPKGQEEAARRFYGKVLGLREIMKTPGERGVWFDLAGTTLKLRVDDAFAHPGEAVRAKLAVDNVEGFRQAAVAGRVRTWDAPAITGTRAVILGDPFGNRVELREFKAGATGALERVREDVGGE